ncbi:MAG TPA: hypothetical protein PLL30_17240 [Candidatus Krumholzibacteria bacterium]|nr:hypothetical protein [Candidatus Krumholzibacteria bacterium]HPD73521.1 hypothetical protein [Candidatus Krumholzibacteria bacterium]HRY42243.1 hypothetical protein [Candidatus Krumholzibacteria bacterium]
MKYRIIKPICFDFGLGRVIGGVGAEFTDEYAIIDVSRWVDAGYLEVVSEPQKVTKEVVAAPVEKRGPRRASKGF